VAVCVIALIYLLGVFASPDPLHDSFSYLPWELQGVLQISVPVIFVWGLLSARLARSAVGDLVQELNRLLPPEELRASLSRALRDPSLELLYAREGRDRWVNVGVQQRSLPGPGDGTPPRAVTLVERAGRPLAALIHDPALDQGLVHAAAAAAGMAIDNARLHAEVRAQLEEVRASHQRIVEAGDRERHRVERNLHDGAQQRLATLALSLAMLRDRDGADPAQAASLAQALAELKQAIGELRELGARDPSGDPHRRRPARGRGIARRPVASPGPRGLRLRASATRASEGRRLLRGLGITGHREIRACFPCAGLLSCCNGSLR